MADMISSIKVKSDELTADELIGRKLTIKITAVEATPGDRPRALFYEGGEKPWKPCLSMRKVIVHVWGDNIEDSYVGRRLTLFRDPTVVWGGMAVGGIRISNMDGLTEPVQIALTVRKGKKEWFVVNPLSAVDVGPQVDVDEIKRQAEAYAKLGTAAFREWFAGLIAGERAAIKPFMDEYKKSATFADAALGPELTG